MLPVVAIAFGAIPAAWCIHRFGIKGTISGGIAVMALASLARGFMPNALSLFSVSIVMGLGIAAFQTALPSAVKVWTPKHVALGSAVYLRA
jgi:CP family cyanate transporter-like MFS transporter